ncbi:endonuclease/exonuclease/phosphatase family protein [Mycobacterium sp. CVI_P3]|uniref:Endonuclease/exonuclease/phosphatase family protein n=1 Tax=Mycobacterium pinniadriaticum TaxID=2994102 RepID=A0ABT3S8I6_9MYCO|nr:endonuclease/exonuclease/phosphatase family protein [Mycobacterium pinniadriaticum]MCX2928649.1 endonuclease/exonuclease/phosphatase family protein [Mycobacterium pinniadriaticum]MCX2935484.1 endonuclease/exonuclease/phosphatase family protein [Mycobacterium pinniadriaticum]
MTFAALAVLARARPIKGVPDLILAVGSPYVCVSALTGLVIAATCRQVILSMVAIVVVIASVGVQVSWYYLGRSPEVGRHTDVRVLSSNLRYGRADPHFLVKLAEAEADVITVAELTPEEVLRLKNVGVEKMFPYSHLLPAARAGGVGIWSRYPLTAMSEPRHQFVKMPAVRLHLHGVRFEPVLAAVHVYSPVAGEKDTVPGWDIGMAGAKAQLRTFARIAGPAAVIIGGDYNSTPDMRQFRDLLTFGYRDAVQQSGSGWTPTFPSNRWYPPLITIDHVLTRNAAATSVRTITVPGSDHRALLATVEVPLDPTAS